MAAAGRTARLARRDRDLIAREPAFRDRPRGRRAAGRPVRGLGRRPGGDQGGQPGHLAPLSRGDPLRRRRAPRVGLVGVARDLARAPRRDGRLRRDDRRRSSRSSSCASTGASCSRPRPAGVLFIYAAPFFVALGAHWLFPAERLHGTKIAGLVAAFAGLSLAFADGLRLPTRREVLGDVLELAGAVLWAATTLIIKARGQAISPHRTLFYQLAGSAVLLGALAAVSGEPGVTRLSGADRGRGALPDRRRRLRELPRLVLAAHPVPGLAPPRVHVLDAALRARRGLAPAGRAGDAGARPRHGAAWRWESTSSTGSRAPPARRGEEPATPRAGAAGPGGRTGGGSPRSAAASGSAPCRRGPGARGTR